MKSKAFKPFLLHHLIEINQTKEKMQQLAGTCFVFPIKLRNFKSETETEGVI